MLLAATELGGEKTGGEQNRSETVKVLLGAKKPFTAT